MSRFAFSKIILADSFNQENEDDDNDIEDIEGYGMFDWNAHGIIGYDEPLQTYFANLDGSWGIGTGYREIPTIAELQRRLSAIFHGIELPFLNDGLLALAAGIEENPLILSPAEAANKE